jgi:hypothetical protein
MHDFFNRHLGMHGSVPTVFDVAPNTTHITSTEPHKIGGPSLVITLTLDGVEMFHY